MNVRAKSAFDRDAQHKRKRDALILSAARAFRRKGYHNTSMKDLADNLNVTRAALYYYVSNKEEVLYECHLLVYDEMDAILAKVPETGTGLARLQAAYGGFARLLTQDGLSLLTEIDSLSEAHYADVLARRDAIEAAVTGIVRAGMKDGSIARANTKLSVYFLMGALNWLNVWYNPDGPVSSEDLATHFVDQMTRGIGA